MDDYARSSGLAAFSEFRWFCSIPT